RHPTRIRSRVATAALPDDRPPLRLLPGLRSTHSRARAPTSSHRDDRPPLLPSLYPNPSGIGSRAATAALRADHPWPPPCTHLFHPSIAATDSRARVPILADPDVHVQLPIHRGAFDRAAHHRREYETEALDRAQCAFPRQ